MPEDIDIIDTECVNGTYVSKGDKLEKESKRVKEPVEDLQKPSYFDEDEIYKEAKKRIPEGVFDFIEGFNTSLSLLSKLMK